MLYNKVEKERIKGNLQSLIDEANKIKAITKTRFLDELERVKEKTKKTCPKIILSYVFSDLDGKDVEHLKEQLQDKAGEVMEFIDKSEKEIIKNILKKVKNTHTVMTIKENPLIPHLLKAVKDNTFITNLNNKEVNYEHIDLALVPVDKIDSNGYISTNRNARLIIEKANKLEIPVYGYMHSLNFAHIIKGEVIKPSMVKSIISELGIFEPELFVQEAKLNYPWLLKQ